MRLWFAIGALAGLTLFCFGVGCGGGGDSTFDSGTEGDGGLVGDAPLFLTDGAARDGTKPCTGLCLKQTTCPGGGKTTVSGTVYEPAGNVALYNVVVYVPNAPVDAITNGATCDKCGSSLSGDPLVATLTDAKGQFSLANVPIVDNMPLVIQVGKWRRQIVVPKITKCGDTPIADRNQTRLPKNHMEGDIPLIALTTGGADTLECLLGKKKIGLDDGEFSTAGGPGRVHLYQGQGGATTKFNPSMAGGVDFADATAFWSDVANLKKYDIVLLSCEGRTFASQKPSVALDAVRDFTSSGGRVFASHWHRYWFAPAPTGRFASTGTWTDRVDPPDPTIATVDVSFPKGVALRDWLVANGSTTPGMLNISAPRHNVDAVSAQAQQWITLPNANAGGQTAVEYMSFNTPLGVAPDAQCGRAVYSDLHVASADAPGPDYPTGCTSNGLSEQEKVLEFMLFDLSACISNDSKPPPPPVK